jgi:hypothetical protein
MGRLSEEYISMLELDPAVARIVGPPSSLCADSASGIAFRLITCTKLKHFGSSVDGHERVCHILTVESAPPENINCDAGRASRHVIEDP